MPPASCPEAPGARDAPNLIGAEPLASSVNPMTSESAPRTLAEQLRSWPDSRLAALLEQRPDLAAPAPSDSTQLASRAAARSSLGRALDALNTLELTVLDALVALGPCSLGQLCEVVYAEPEAVATAAERLLDLAVIWGEPEHLRALRAVSEAGALLATGLRAPIGSDPERVATSLGTLTEPARALLDHLDAHGGEGTTGGVGSASAAAVTDLVAKGLLTVKSPGRVVVPGEVSLVLREGRTTRSRADQPPALATSTRDPDAVERAAAGAALESVRRTELLLDGWSTAPPSALRSGGLAVRDLKAAAGLLHVSEAVAALLIEVAAAAGLLTTGHTPDGEAAWLPTDAFDAWSALDQAEQWVRLIDAWLPSSRLSALVGTREVASGKTRNALAAELTSTFAAESRRTALEVLADLPRDEVLAAGTGVASVVSRVVWLRPRRPLGRADMVVWALTEAAELGLTGLGGLSQAGRLILTGDDASAVADLHEHLPTPVDHVLVQADLTAVAPGPLRSDLARTLHTLADVESRGGATVYRFSANSVRRAFDAGWSAAEVHDFLAALSRTPVPQPLTYLVDDVSRTFGTLRVGHAEAFVRADDEMALTELLHHPKAESLGLRRLAPTVLISTVPIDLLLPRLRELGAAPVVEAADGTVRVARPDLLRARTPRERRTPGLTRARQVAHLTAVVTAIRAGDRAVAERPTGAEARGGSSPIDSLAALREAAERSATVWIGYVDSHGGTSERIVDPVSVEGGQLRAFDHRSQDYRLFAVHRITGVRAVPA